MFTLVWPITICTWTCKYLLGRKPHSYWINMRAREQILRSMLSLKLCVGLATSAQRKLMCAQQLAFKNYGVNNISTYYPLCNFCHILHNIFFLHTLTTKIIWSIDWCHYCIVNIMEYYFKSLFCAFQIMTLAITTVKWTTECT